MIVEGVNRKISKVYGFVADPSLTSKHNATRRLADMTPYFYFTRPYNLAFHDLTTTNQPPKNL